MQKLVNILFVSEEWLVVSLRRQTEVMITAAYGIRGSNNQLGLRRRRQSSQRCGFDLATTRWPQ